MTCSASQNIERCRRMHTSVDDRDGWIDCSSHILNYIWGEVCFGMAVASERFKRGWKSNLITIQFDIDCLHIAVGKGSSRRKLTIGLLSQSYWWTSWKHFSTKVVFKSHLEVGENNLNHFNRIRGGKRQWGWFGNVKHVIKGRRDMKPQISSLWYENETAFSHFRKTVWCYMLISTECLPACNRSCEGFTQTRYANHAHDRYQHSALSNVSLSRWFHGVVRHVA